MPKKTVVRTEDYTPLLRPEVMDRALRALRAAAQDARKTARFYGTPLYYWRNGKVVAVKP